MKMNENTNGQFITIFKKNEQFTNIYIHERYQRKLQTTHPWYQPTFTVTLKIRDVATSRPLVGLHVVSTENTFSRFQTDLARSNRSKRPAFYHLKADRPHQA